MCFPDNKNPNKQLNLNYSFPTNLLHILLLTRESEKKLCCFPIFYEIYASKLPIRIQMSLKL